jgi:hypothetical protein
VWSAILIIRSGSFSACATKSQPGTTDPHFSSSRMSSSIPSNNLGWGGNCRRLATILVDIG